MKVVGMPSLTLFFVLFAARDQLTAMANEEFQYSERDFTFPKIFHSGERSAVILDSLEGKHPNKLSVEMSAFGRNIFLDLQLNSNILAKNFVEKHISKNGKVIARRKEKGHHCHYLGNVRGVAGSIVAVSTCQGLRGIVNGVDELYIEPFKVARGQHVVYKVRSWNGTRRNFPCGVSSEPSSDHSQHKMFHQSTVKRLKRSVKPSRAIGEPAIIELFFVADHSAFKKFGDATGRRLVDIVNIANSMFIDLNVRVVLTGTEIWSEKNRIQIGDVIDNVTMDLFLNYTEKHILPFHHYDAIYLQTTSDFFHGVGRGSFDTLCSASPSAGVIKDTSDPLWTSMIVAHELGHNLGFAHDGNDCECDTKYGLCLMEAELSSDVGSKFSSCSKKILKNTIDDMMCLFDKPKSVYGAPQCGNGLVEDGEQCDCGLPQFCPSKCCNPVTCMLEKDAQCASGPCCNSDTCRYDAKTTVCRPSRGECDMPEFCTEKSESCPRDVFKEQGTPCGEASHCFNGYCNNATGACKELHGHDSRVCHQSAFDVNLDGINGGDCGYHLFNHTFKKCKDADKLCGRLHCVIKDFSHLKKVSKNLILRRAILYMSPRVTCAAVVMHYGIPDFDPGLVPDGTSCGHGKMCYKQRCLSFKEVPTMTQTDISQQVCDSDGKCHCKNGGQPPFCDKPGAVVKGSSPAPSGSVVCGNGVVDSGEECDCGILSECKSTCCNPSSCKFLEKGTICRPAANICDLPEYCDGVSNECPSDYFKRDGTVCKQGEAYCFKRRCSSRTDSCKSLWGPSATPNSWCFSFNTFGMQAGNCGRNRKTNSYIACENKDSLCGLLHCKSDENILIYPRPYKYALPIYSPQCNRAEIETVDGTRNPGLVADGSHCGTGKMCVNSRCQTLQAIGILPCDCNSHGVCNNKGECHCDDGYQPPFCDKPGDGGSVRGGPAASSAGSKNIAKDAPRALPQPVAAERSAVGSSLASTQSLSLLCALCAFIGRGFC